MKRILFAAVVAIVAAASAATVFFACALNQSNQYVRTEYVFEAENGTLDGFFAESTEECLTASGGGCVANQVVGSSLTLGINAEQPENDVKMTVVVSCPMAWSAEGLNLPQNFYFNDLYTLYLNGADITPQDAHVNGSIDEKDNKNYYFWVEISLLVNLEKQNVFVLRLTSTGDRCDYNSFGNLDCIRFSTYTKLGYAQTPKPELPDENAPPANNEYLFMKDGMTRFVYGQPIEVIASVKDSVKDWVGIYARNDNPALCGGSFYFYYPDTDGDGKAVNIIGRNKHSTRLPANENYLPPGSYTVRLLADDGYRTIEYIEIEVVAA